MQRFFRALQDLGVPMTGNPYCKLCGKVSIRCLWYLGKNTPPSGTEVDESTRAGHPVLVGQVSNATW